MKEPLSPDTAALTPKALPASLVLFQGFTPLSAGASRQDHAFQPPPPSPWPGKSHEAEDVALRSSPQIHVTQCSSSSDEKLDDPGREEESAGGSANTSSRTFPLQIPHDVGHVSLPVKQMSKYSQSLAKGSPPPRVLLQSLRSPRSGKDPAPVRASHDSDILAQVQRGGLASVGGERETAEVSGGAGPYSRQGFDAARSMEAINDAEYIAVKPKLTIIRREESIHSNVSSYSSGSGSSLGMDSLSSVTLSSSPSARSTSSTSSVGSGSTLAADSVRPSQPPAYAAALQRKFMLDHDVPVDVSPLRESQRKANEKAKMLYEESLQKYLQDRYEQKHTVHAAVARKISDPGTPTTSSGIAVGHVRSESDQPPRASPSEDDAVSGEDMSVTPPSQPPSQTPSQPPSQTPSQQHARKLYLESLERYEQQQTVSARTAEDDDRRDNGAPRNVENVGETGARQRVVDTFTESSTQHRTARCVTESRTHQRSAELWETRTSVSRDSRPKSMLEIPASTLHRSLSDSADRLNNLGQREKSGHRHAVQSGVNSERVAVCQSSRRKTSDSVVHERRDRSDSSPARHYFPTASCFYHPEDSPRSGKNSPASRSPRSQSPRRHLDAQRYARVDSAAVQSPRVDSSAVKSPRVGQMVVVSSRVDNSAARLARSESPVLGSPRTSPPSAVRGCGGVSSSADVGRSHSGASSESGSRTAGASSNPAASGGGKTKTELGWSVKNLRKLYSSGSAPGQEHPTESPRPGPSASLSSGARPAPPPYQDPPPFRRLQDRSRLSTSSNSSNGSSSTGRSSSPSSRGSVPSARRLGPQGVPVDYSSSEELTYHNSRWSRARSESGSGSGLSDQEMTNAFTDISYV